MNGCLIKSRDTADDKSLQAIGYYDDNLQKSGWKILVTASGVYSSTDSYQRPEKYFVVKRYPNTSTSQQTLLPLITVELFYNQ